MVPHTALCRSSDAPFKLQRAWRRLLAFHFRRVDPLLFIALVAGFALLGAWIVNAVVGMMSGEKPGDTGRQWADMFFRILGVGRIGVLGRILSYAGTEGWPRRILWAAGVISLLALLAWSCRG